MNRMPDMDGPAYDEFARFYHRHWASSPYYREAQAVLDCLLFSLLPRGSAVLDLCCGTGIMARAAVKRGFAVTGLDISGGMLRYARRELPQSAFLQCDARSFLLPPMFSGAFSTFESMNHILTASGLEQVFSRVSAALAPGGIFVFDLLTEQAYETLWSGSYEMSDVGESCILRGGYDPRRRTAWTDVKIFRRGSGGTSSARISEKFHDPGETARSLAGAGFADAGLFCADTDLGMTGKFGVGRVFLRAVKPGLLEHCPEVKPT